MDAQPLLSAKPLCAWCGDPVRAGTYDAVLRLWECEFCFFKRREHDAD